MSAPSSVCSDDSFEIVNNEVDIEDVKDDVVSLYKPKVTFHEVFDVYPMDADIVAKVTFDHDYVQSDEDTVVVLPIAWKSVDQALCAANINGTYVRFEVKDLPKIGAEDKFYQLCYCTAEKIVMGVSIPFSFREVHEDELVEFQKEQNKEFWTFRSRFAVLTDNYWNALMDKKPAPAKEELNKTTNDDQSGSGETSVYEPCENNDNLDKPAENAVPETKILLFQLMKEENEKMKQENQKLKSVVFEVTRAMSVNDRETRHRMINSAVNGSGEVFAEEEFSELRELLEKGLTVSTPHKLSENVPEAGDSHENTNDSFDIVAMNDTANEKILLFKIMENENAALKKQYEEEVRLHAEARNKIDPLKHAFMEILNSSLLHERLRQGVEKLLPFISSAFEGEELVQLRNALKKRRVDSLKEMVEKQMNKFEVTFVGTSDGNILLADQCDKQVSTEASKTTAHESVKKWEAKIAVLSEERDKLQTQVIEQQAIIKNLNEQLVNQRPSEVDEIKTVISVTDFKVFSEKNNKLQTEVNEQQAIIKNLNEQLINQRQSEVEKMITVTNNMRDQYLKNMNQLTDTNKVLEEQLKSKDEEIKSLNGNLLAASKLLTESEREIRDLKARDLSFVGFLERRNLKRISELGEKLQVKQAEMYSKVWAERQESAKLKDDLLTTQTLLNSLCDELEKNSSKKSIENSAQTGDDVSNAAGTSSASPSALPISETPPTSAGFRRIKQREQALATKLVEMTAHLENMKAIHDKTKTDLESRLKDGAKQYAKLYMKYEKLMKRSPTQSRETSN